MVVKVSHDGPVTIVTIDRPEVRNAINGEAARRLAEVFREFDSNPAQSAAVLTGAGGTFCAGADLKAVSSGQDNLRVSVDGDGPLGCSRMLLSKPVKALKNMLSILILSHFVSQKDWEHPLDRSLPVPKNL